MNGVIGALTFLAQTSSGSSGIVGWVFIIGVAVIFGAWTANAAERKGYPRSTGWALGILLGILGRIIMGVMRDKNQQVPQPSIVIGKDGFPVAPPQLLTNEELEAKYGANPS